MNTRSRSALVSPPITCWSVTHSVLTPRGIKYPQHKKTVGAFRPLERGLLLGNTERLCLTHRLLPLLVGSLNSAPQHHPFAPSLYRGLRRYYEWFRPCAPLPYSRPHGASTWASPFASVLQVPTFRPTASDRLRPP